MPITPEDFQRRLLATKEAVTAQLPDIAQRLTSNAKALSERNILQRGFGAVYSSNRIPAFFLAGKELNAGGRSYLELHGVNTGRAPRRRRNSTPIDHTATWAEFRASQGRQVVWVDLAYSGVMWRGLQPLAPTINGNVIICRLGATNTQAQKEVEYNYKRFGNFILKGLASEDYRILEQSVIDDIGNIINDKLI